MRYFKYIFIVFLISISFSIIYYSKNLDVTEKPIRSDVVFCLGGNKYRTLESLKLLSNNYSKYNTLYFFGSKKLFYNHLKHLRIDGLFFSENISKKNIIFISNMKNTMDEIKFIEKTNYLYKNLNFIIVTDPAHSLRVKFMLNTFTKNLHYIIVSSNPPWRDKKYFLNIKIIKFTIKELFKIPYNYIKYKIYFFFSDIL